MIGKILEALYTKVFINIIVKSSQTTVYVEVCSNSNVVNTLEKTFDTTTINAKMYEFIKACKKESPYYYISVLDKSAAQGAIPSCDASAMSKYSDVSPAKSICCSNKWSVYTSEYDLSLLENDYRSIGVDFIFSPFLIMSRFFKDKIESTMAMFILVEENHISLAVFDNSKLLYAEYIDMQSGGDEDDMLMEAPIDDDDDSLDIDGIDLNEIDLDDEDNELDDFANIEDLDSGDDIDEFSEAQDIEEIIHTHDEDDLDSEGFNEDYQRFLFIQSSLSVFYRDEKYESKFIENVYIADSIGVSKDLKGYLEEEMFLNVYVRKLDLGVEVSDMAKAELK